MCRDLGHTVSGNVPSYLNLPPYANSVTQRNFRKVMRSALAQVRGRMAEDLAEQQHWRREVLSLYRWTGDGTGLAL